MLLPVLADLIALLLPVLAHLAPVARRQLTGSALADKLFAEGITALARRPVGGQLTGA